MLVDFKSLADSSKIWIYQSNREFTDTEVSEISDAMEKFISCHSFGEVECPLLAQSGHSIDN